MKTCSGQDFLAEVRDRRQTFFEQYDPTVRAILERVRSDGDQAVRDLTEQFDGVRLPPDGLTVSRAEITAAYALVSVDLLPALTAAIGNVRSYHERQMRNSWFEATADGSILGQRFGPLQRVGLYVPGGTAAYPSSVLMNAIPAQVAGVPELVICTPPLPDGSVNPSVLVAADQLGILTIYKAGGAQAVAAMAFGTETLAAVDKIVGPGNIYVTAAKRLVYGYVDIDMLAGPSEIMILADSFADPSFLAADLLSQAEHDRLAQAVLVTPARELVEPIQDELRRQLAALPRADQAGAALEEFGRIVLVADLAEAVNIANCFAPEHLELMVADPWALLGQVRHAGAIFLGPFSPEPIGDYAGGPSHVLPTGGTARFASGLTVDSFRKSTSIIAISPAGLDRLAATAVTLATSEGLAAHAKSVQMRSDSGVRDKQPPYTQPGRFGGCFH